MPWRLPALDTLPKSPPPQVVEAAVEGNTAPLAVAPTPAPVSGWRRLLPQTKSRDAYESGLRAMDAKNYEAAVQAFEQVVAHADRKGKLNAASVTTELARFYLCDALLRLAYVLFDANSGEPAAQEQAIAHLNRAIALGSQNADVFALLGKIYQAAKREPEAAQAFNRAAALQTGASRDAKASAPAVGASTASAVGIDTAQGRRGK